MEVFVNVIFTGKMDDRNLSDEEILKYFRETHYVTFITRLHQLKFIIHHYYWYRGYMGLDDNEDSCNDVEITKLRPFINCLNRIRKYITFGDIIKYMLIDPRLYFSEDFRKIYEKDRKLAYELYVKYFHINNNCGENCNDWEIYRDEFKLIARD